MKIEVGKKYILQNGWVVTIQRWSPSVILGDCPNGWTFNWDIDGTHYAGVRKGQDIVKEYEGEPMKNRYTAMLPGTITGHVMQTQHIQSIEKPAEFKVGDRVRAVDTTSFGVITGEEYEVLGVDSLGVWVGLAGGRKAYACNGRFVPASEQAEFHIGEFVTTPGGVGEIIGMADNFAEVKLNESSKFWMGELQYLGKLKRTVNFKVNTSVSCIHEYTNQSFMGVLMACKHCGASSI